MLSRLILPLIAPLAFWCAHLVFRNRALGEGRLKRWVLGCYRLAADVGHRKALSVYGYLLFLRGDTTQSRIQGGIYLQRAADKGDARAQFQMGKVFELGFELYFRPDAAKALRYYQQAAAQKHPLAINRLAQAYEKGELGLIPDPVLAKRFGQSLVG